MRYFFYIFLYFYFNNINAQIDTLGDKKMKFNVQSFEVKNSKDSDFIFANNKCFEDYEVSNHQFKNIKYKLPHFYKVVDSMTTADHVTHMLFYNDIPLSSIGIEKFITEDIEKYNAKKIQEELILRGVFKNEIKDFGVFQYKGLDFYWILIDFSDDVDIYEIIFDSNPNSSYILRLTAIDDFNLEKALCFTKYFFYSLRICLN